MTNKIKLIILAVALAFITSAAFALYHYYTKSNQLEKDLEKSDDLISSLRTEIDSKNKEIDNIKIDVKKQNEQLLIIKEKSNAYKNEVEVINQKLSGDRLVKIATKKRKLLQNVINKANDKEIEEINKITKNGGQNVGNN